MTALQIVLFCICIGREPRGLAIAVYNGDALTPVTTPLNQSYSQVELINRTMWFYILIFQAFLKLVEDQDLSIVYYDSEESAIDAVRKSKQWTALVFAPNYTNAMIERIRSPMNSTDETVKRATVQEFADLTEFPIQVTIRQKFAMAQLRFVNLWFARIRPVKVFPQVYCHH